ncbi:hypothetical protein HMPREF1640_05595 [Prevotella sp. S7-1-8]|nr:hypothetical protein HMPREF1640_05595 [Prevotella sp. S7-1-8]
MRRGALKTVNYFLFISKFLDKATFIFRVFASRWHFVRKYAQILALWQLLVKQCFVDFPV